MRALRAIVWGLYFLTGALALPGCATGRVNLWPLFFHENRWVETPEGRRKVATTEVLYPFFSRESYDNGSWHALRPLYNYEYRRREGQHRVQYLWPLGLHFKDRDQETHHRFFLLFEYERIFSPGANRYSTHAHLLQLIRWGNDDQWGPYFAVIPLGGVTHDVIGDTWSFILFPLYSHYRSGNYVRDDLPWPLLGYGRTPDGTKTMYRLWPFYVYQRKNTRTELLVRHDLMWPFIRWGKRDRGGPHYFTVAVVAPFYSAVERRDRTGKVVDARRFILGISFGHIGDEEQSVGGWSALWSLMRGSKSSKVDEFRIMPFYWSRTIYEDKQHHPELRWTRRWAPWPLVCADSDQRDPKHLKSGFVIGPLYWHYTDTFPQDAGPPLKGRRITLWPLMTWEREPQGAKHFWILSHGWNDTTQGYKRNYRAFFDFFQYHSSPQGGEVRLFSRLYHQRRTPQGRYFSLACLFTYDSTGEVVGQDGSYVSFLFDLVKCSWTDRGTRWRLFYIPLGGTDSEEPDATVP